MSISYKEVSICSSKIPRCRRRRENRVPKRPSQSPRPLKSVLNASSASISFKVCVLCSLQLLSDAPSS